MDLQDTRRVRITLRYKYGNTDKFIVAEVPVKNLDIEYVKARCYLVAYKRYYETVDVTKYVVLETQFRIMEGMEGLHMP